jgi:hypothetical protein
MKRAAALAGFLLASESPAFATGEILCGSADGGVSIYLGVSSSETLNILRATVTIGDEIWSTDVSVEPGKPLAIGQAYGNDGQLFVDFVSEPAGPVIGRLKVLDGREGEFSASGGILTMKEKGAWVVDCSEPE